MQSINLQDKRPPFVQFEMRAEKDSTSSLKEGRPMFTDVPYVMVLQHGGKDMYEKRAEEWLDQKHREAANGSYPPDWAKAYRHMYEEWKKGNAIPLNGTPIKLWPGATPAEVAACIAANVLTVEDLAGLSEAGLHSIGLGGRALRDKARSYMQAAESNGKVVELLASVKAELETLKGELEAERVKRRELESALADKRGPGRPRKEDVI